MPDIALAVRAEAGSSLGHLGVGSLAGQVADAAAQYPAIGRALSGMIVIVSHPRLVLTSLSRSERLTDAETVRIGRLLLHFLPTNHVSYPDDTPTVVVIAHDHDLTLAPAIRTHMEEFLGVWAASVISDGGPS